MGGLFPAGEAESAYGIDFYGLRRKGFRGVLFDIDNTLVPHGAPATPEAVRYFDRLKSAGFEVCLISNNGEERVKSFADRVGSRYVFKAGKPSRRGYILGMEKMGTAPEETLFVGDQIFTDVWGANRAGLCTCLVSPIHPKEEIQIVAKRLLERPIIRIWRLLMKDRIRFDKKGSVLLIGFMGAGKSTVGKALAKLLGLPYLDTDAEIERKRGMKISEIFAAEGEESFRREETQLLRDLAGEGKPAVISCGGGMPLREENRELMAQIGTVVYLTAAPATVAERLKGDTTRPLLQVPNPEAEIRALMEKRRGAYAQAADFSVRTEEGTPAQLAETIRGRLFTDLK